jgi:hypothetical protein
MSEQRQRVVPFRVTVSLTIDKWMQTDSIIDHARAKARPLRLEVGHLLVALRKRVEDGEDGDEAAIDWWGWYADNFTRNRSDAQKLMKIARDHDPGESGPGSA